MAGFLKLPVQVMAHAMAYAQNAPDYDADAERYTREAEAQDTYGKARRKVRVFLSPEDYTTTAGGLLTEEVRDAALRGWVPAGRSDLKDAALSWRKPWTQEEAPAIPAE